MSVDRESHKFSKRERASQQSHNDVAAGLTDLMPMDFDSLNEIQHNEALRKRLAKLMAHDCFRNTKLEDFHSGKYPSSKTGDYSDVKVVSPFGEIPWKELSRLSDEETKIR